MRSFWKHEDKQHSAKRQKLLLCHLILGIIGCNYNIPPNFRIIATEINY